DVVADMLTTLSLVGDQQAVICLATEDEVKTPGQSNRVAKSRAHAFTSERGHQVRCIASDECTAGAPLFGPASLETVARGAFHDGVVWINTPWLQQVPCAFLGCQFFDVLAWQRHKLPTATARATWHDGGGALWIAQLPVVWSVLNFRGWLQIQNQPVEEETQVIHVKVQLIANEAVCPVGTNDVAGAQLFHFSVRIFNFWVLGANAVQGRGFIVLLQIDDIPATADFNVLHAGGDIAQSLLQLWLVEPVAGAPARLGHGVPVNFHEGLALAVAPGV